jgi:dolichol-phosphate mannosyltransferase
MQDECELSVVLPAYREAASLRSLLPKLVQAVHSVSANAEIIVSDSMEPLDDTDTVCKESSVIHIRRSGGNSYGDAVRSGIQRSRGSFVLLMDADGSHNPEVLPMLWSRRNEAGTIIGSRYVKGGATENPAVLILMSRVLNYAYQIAFRLPVSDVSNSLRLYHGDQLRSLQLVSDNFDIVEEILIRLVAGRTHSTVLEVPVTFEQRKAGESKRNLPAFMLSYLGSMRKMQRFRREELARQDARQNQGLE